MQKVLYSLLPLSEEVECVHNAHNANLEYEEGIPKEFSQCI